MANKNLRIIYNNLVDISTTTLNASSSAITSTNLLNDSKSKLWRSATCTTTSVKIFLKVVLVDAATIGGVVLPFTNLTTAATIRIYGYSGTAPSLGGTTDSPTFTPGATLNFDTGTGVLACPYSQYTLWNLGTIPNGSNMYSYGGGTYARGYVPTNIQAPCNSLIIEINDVNPSKYIEAGRLIVGQYWSPIYNTGFGLSYNPKELSTHTRTHAGDMITNRGPRYSGLTFDLKFMGPADKDRLQEITKGNGMARPMFVSLFPENSDDYNKEQMYQIYGKMNTVSGIQHSTIFTYGSQMDLEEV